MIMCWRFILRSQKMCSTTGQAAMQALASLEPDARKSADYHLCLCELNLLGDPTLDMRAADPRTPDLKVPTSIETGSCDVVIATDAPGAQVCLWKGLEVYVVARLDAEGKATVKVEPKTAGELLVTITGPSLNAATGSIEVRGKE